MKFHKLLNINIQIKTHPIQTRLQKIHKKNKTEREREVQKLTSSRCNPAHLFFTLKLKVISTITPPLVSTSLSPPPPHCFFLHHRNPSCRHSPLDHDKDDDGSRPSGDECSEASEEQEAFMDFCLSTTNFSLPHFFLFLLLDSVSCGGCFSLVGFFFVAGFSGSLFSRSLMLFMASTLGGSPDIAFFSVAIVCAVVIKMI